jgi:hypothetical protein
MRCNPAVAHRQTRLAWTVAGELPPSASVTLLLLLLLNRHQQKRALWLQEDVLVAAQ